MREALFGGRWRRRAWCVAALGLMAEVVAFLVASWASGELCGYGCQALARRTALEGWIAQSGRPTSADDVAVETAKKRPIWVDKMLQDQSIHPFLGFVDNPDSYSLAIHGETHPEARDFGLLGNRHPIFHQPREDQLIVAVIGGSVARQISATGGREWLESELAQVPRFADREVKVLTLAVGGYKAPQPLLSLTYLLSLGFHADVVISVDGLNDISLAAKDNIPYGVHPSYPRSWNFRVAGSQETDSLVRGEIRLLNHQRRRLATLIDAAPWRFSMTAQALWRVVDRRFVAWLEARQERLSASPAHGQYFAHGPPSDPMTPRAFANDSVALWERSSRLLHELSQEHAFEYHHFLQPNQYDGQKQLLNHERKQAYHVNSPFRARVEVAYPLLRERGEALRAEGVNFHDITGLFEQVREPLYVDYCCHVNLRGVELLARAIAERLADAPATQPVLARE